MEKKYFPLFISLEQKKVLLAGAGSIALRRARGLLDFGADLTVIAPKTAPEFQELRGQYGKERLLILARAFAPGDTAGFDLVLSATDDPQTDLAVYRECKEAGIPVNIASDQRLCDFYFPALIQGDGLVIGVGSGGSDPGKVRRVSAKLREWMGQQKTETEKGGGQK